MDFGQNIAGRVAFTLKGVDGAKILLEHSEILDQQGIFVNNIQGRYRNQTDIYISKGSKVETYEPSFTYHGFRYVRVSGWPGEININDFNAHILCTDMRITSDYYCSDENINKLQKSILSSQIGNMISILTDCPQREKAGWTGDVQVFAPTACFNMGILSFFKRWLRIMREEQLIDGQIPNVIPYWKTYQPRNENKHENQSSAGWGDVSTVLPWTLYNVYGDKSILEENYEMMRKWVEYIRKTASEEKLDTLDIGMPGKRKEGLRYIWNTGFHFGDWAIPSISYNTENSTVDLMQNSIQTKHIIPTCFFAYSTEILAKVSYILGKTDECEKYNILLENIKAAFVSEFVDEMGYIDTKFQGIYVMALSLQLIPRHVRNNAITRLIEMIYENDMRLDTAILSTPFLLDLLTKEGCKVLALDLLYQDKSPSWLYQIKMGATTLWEIWQAVLPDGKPTSVSFNHFALASVGDWLYRVIGGINALKPGYEEILIKPEIKSRLSFSSISYKSLYGLIACKWDIKDGWARIEVTTPANTAAVVNLPFATLDNVSLDGVSLKDCKDIYESSQGDNNVEIAIGSGVYVFIYPLSS